jgi:hypothetical protein
MAYWVQRRTATTTSKKPPSVLNTVPINSTNLDALALRIGLFAPTDGQWVRLSVLETKEAEQFHEKLSHEYTASDAHKARYCTMADDPWPFINSGQCLNKITRASNRQCTYVQADGDKERACDSCINLEMLCVRPLHDSS